MSRLEIELPLPPVAASPNSRCYWAVKHKATAKMRSDGWLAATSAIREQKPAGLPWERATVRATFFFRTRRRRDQDNANASLKAYLDSLQDAGVVLNDSFLEPLPPVFEVDGSDPRVVLVVERVKQPEDYE